MARQVCLIEEADLRGHVRERLAAEDPVPRGLEPTPQDVRVRRDPERRRKRPRELCGAHADHLRRGPDRDRLEEMLVEDGTELLGGVGPRNRGVGGLVLPESQADPFGDEGEPGLGLESVVGAFECVVERGEPASKVLAADDRPVHGGPDEMLAEDGGFEIQHPLSEAAARRRPPVVHDVRRKQAHHRMLRPVGASTEVVPDRAVVHDEQRPHVVGVGRVGVVREAGVEDLADPRDGGLPGADRRGSRGDCHLRIVQDACRRASYRRFVETLVALAAFSVVSSITPGPNNVLLWASGASFGFRATVRHVLGTALGIGLMALLVAGGLGALFAAVPDLAVAMKVGASVYLLYLAYQVAGARALERGELARPLGIRQAAAFQAINPKAWIFALGAVAAFRPPGYPLLAGSLLVALTMAIVVVPTAAVWAGAGGALNGLMAGDRSRRGVSRLLAALLAATVVFVWL